MLCWCNVLDVLAPHPVMWSSTPGQVVNPDAPEIRSMEHIDRSRQLLGSELSCRHHADQSNRQRSPTKASPLFVFQH